MPAFKNNKGLVLQRRLKSEDGITGDDLLMIADAPDYAEAERAQTNFERRQLYVQAIVLRELSDYLFEEVGGRQPIVVPITIQTIEPPPLPVLPKTPPLPILSPVVKGKGGRPVGYRKPK